MAYRPHVNLRERTGAIAAVIAVHAALLLALLNLSGKIELPNSQSALRVIDIPQLKPQPQHEQRQPEKLKSHKAGGAAKNIKSDAASFQAPLPKIPSPPVVRIVASETPREGTMPTQGASPVQGSGAGGGGVGNGSGAGTGSGAGGNDHAVEPPHLATPVLSGRDFPSQTLSEWPRGATIFLRLRIDPSGYVAECLIDRGTGVPAIDSAICNLAHDRLRFRPATNQSGQAVAGWFGYAQPPPR